MCVCAPKDETLLSGFEIQYNSIQTLSNQILKMYEAQKWLRQQGEPYQNMAEQLLETANNAWLRLIWFCHGKITRHYTPGDFENHMSLTVWSTALPHPLEDPSISWPITGRLNSCVIKMEPQWAGNEVNWSLTGIKWGFTLTKPLWRGSWLWNNSR